MIGKRHPSEILLALFAVLLPFKAGGCGNTACITVTAAMMQSGTCPSQAEAQMRIVGQSCPGTGTVASVDGPGTFSDNLCCYPVTDQSNNNQVTTFGVGGSATCTGTIFPGMTTGVGTGGFGGSTGGQCVTCESWLTGAPFGQICPDTASAMAFQSLQACACTTNCTTQCMGTVCVDNAPDNGCLSCIETACGAQLVGCQQD